MTDFDDDDLEGLVDPPAGVRKAERVRQRALWRQRDQRILAENPDHPTIEHIVDDRVFLLGLDQLYRERMKGHESTELLACARAVAATLNVQPADVPIEGYYAETRRLREYFRLIHGLRALRDTDAPRVARMPEFQRLSSVMSAPLYGRPVALGQLKSWHVEERASWRGSTSCSLTTCRSRSRRTRISSSKQRTRTTSSAAARVSAGLRLLCAITTGR